MAKKVTHPQQKILRETKDRELEATSSWFSIGSSTSKKFGMTRKKVKNKKK